MKTVVSIVLSVFLLALPLSGQALFNKKSPDEQRQELQDERKAALDKLYSEKPSVREELKSSKGYAVFSSLGINVLLVSTENGGGILHDNLTGKDTYMNMFSAGVVSVWVSRISSLYSFFTRRRRWTSSRNQAGIFRVRRMLTRKHQPRAGEQKLPAA